MRVEGRGQTRRGTFRSRTQAPAWARTFSKLRFASGSAFGGLDVPSRRSGASGNCGPKLELGTEKNASAQCPARASGTYLSGDLKSSLGGKRSDTEGLGVPIMGNLS